MKNIVSKMIFIAFSIAMVTATLIITTVYINESSLTDATVINVAGRERMLSQKITQEILYITAQPKKDFTLLNELIGEFEHGLLMLIDGNTDLGIYHAPSEEILTKLENAKKLWHSLKERFDLIAKTKDEILGQTENFLQLTPKFQQSTLEVAQMMNRRRLPQKMVIEAENQVGLANSIVLLASSYLATGDENTLNEFYSTIDSYASTLEGFANTDLIVHGSILALLADNQFAWEGYHDAVLKAVSGKKQLVVEVQKIYNESAILLSSLEEMVSAYTTYSEKIRMILQWVQYLFTALLIAVLGYSFLLIWQMKEHFSLFITKSKNLSTASFEELKDLNLGEGLDLELKEAGEHINLFAHRVEELLKITSKISAELEILGDTIGEKVADSAGKSLTKSESIAIDSIENMSKTIQLLSSLKKELDQARG